MIGHSLVCAIEELLVREFKIAFEVQSQSYVVVVAKPFNTTPEKQLIKRIIRAKLIE